MEETMEKKYSETIQEYMACFQEGRKVDWGFVADAGRVFLLTGNWPNLPQLEVTNNEERGYKGPTLVFDVIFGMEDAPPEYDIEDVERLLLNLEGGFLLVYEHRQLGHCPLSRQRRKAFGGEEGECPCLGLSREIETALRWLIEFDGLILAAEHYSFPLPDGFRKRWDSLLKLAPSHIFKFKLEDVFRREEPFREEFFSQAMREFLARARG